MVKVRPNFGGPSTSANTVRHLLRGISAASTNSTTDGDDFSGFIKVFSFLYVISYRTA